MNLRDGKKCLLTGLESDTQISHIVGEKVAPPELANKPENAVRLHKFLEASYTDNQWCFNTNGEILVLFAGCPHKAQLESKVRVSFHDGILPINENGNGVIPAPSRELIELKMGIAQEDAKNRCPGCWKLCPPSSQQDHLRRKSCEDQVKKLKKRCKPLPLPPSSSSSSSQSQVNSE